MNVSAGGCFPLSKNISLERINYLGELAIWFIFIIPVFAYSLYSWIFTADHTDTLTRYNMRIDAQGVCTVPQHIVRIENGCFKNRKDLKKIVFTGASPELIGEEAFAGSGLESIEIPRPTKVIEKGLFEDCESLVSVNIPGSLLGIRDNAFRNCRSLEEIRLPETVIFIDKWAFSSCYALKSVNIPKSAEQIGDHAFCHPGC